MRLGTSVHYGWVVVFAGMLCIFAALGFGRFALGMLLPSMGESLGLTYSEMGFISTGNFVGYLLSVLASGFLAVRFGPRLLIFSSLVLVGISMVLISRTSGFLPILLLYLATGVGSGGANVPMMGLVSAWFSRKRRGSAAGFVVIGSGFAIILAGWLIPFVNRVEGHGGWRTNWLLLGCIVLAVAAVCLRLIRNTPSEMGLTPVGSETSPPRSFDRSESIYQKGIIHHLGVIYFLFGYSYVIYATFFVTSLVNDWGMSEAGAGELWSWVGVLSLLSGPVFGTLSDKVGRRVALAAVFLFQGAAYLIVASGLPPEFLPLSVFLYGVAAWSIPSIMAAAVGDYVGALRAPEAFGFITFIFALGQISGPAVAGVMAERAGSFAGSFLMAAFLAGSAALLSLFLRRAPQS